MESKSRITDWQAEDRPRERFLREGPERMSDAELLALLCGTGTTGVNVLELMQQILSDCHGSLALLGRLSVEELCRYNGIGKVKAITLLAACELGRRRSISSDDPRPRLTSSDLIYEQMRQKIQDKSVEESWVVLLNNSLKLIKTVLLSRGGMTETLVDVRVLLREALLAGATTIVLCHNHPSGQTRPSPQDDSLTKRVKEACQIVRIHLMDHLILTDQGYYSYADEGRL